MVAGAAYKSDAFDERRGPAEPSRLRLSTTEWDSWWQALYADADDPAGRIAREQGFVLTPQQALSAGISRSRQRTAVRRERWWTPRRGALAITMPDLADPSGRRRAHALDAAAGALLHPDHVVSAGSAAVLHGLPTMRIEPVPVLSTDPDDGAGLRPKARLRDARTLPDEIARWYGVPVHSVARTVLDLARHSQRDGLMAADAALHRGLLTPQQVSRAIARATGWPGVRRAREILALSDGRAESALESVIRLALHRSGLPPPELQVWIAGFRVDFFWPKQRFVLEADGAVKYRGAGVDNDTMWLEKNREAALRRAGCSVDRVIWADVLQYWPSTCRRIATQLGM